MQTRSFHLLEERVTTVGTRNVRTRLNTSLDASSHLFFIFIDDLDSFTALLPRTAVILIPLSSFSNASVFCNNRQLSFSPSSACSSLFPDLIKMREQQAVKILKSAVEAHCLLLDICVVTKWDSVADARSCNFNTQTRSRINHDPFAMHDGCYSNSSANNDDRDAQTSEWGRSAVFFLLSWI
jgi:hypothetical protein